MDERVAIDKYGADTYVVGKYRVEEVRAPIFHEQGIWRYKATNTEIGKEFRYTLFVAISTLEEPGDISEVRDAIESKGKSLVQNWLDRGIEEDRVAIIGKTGIEEFTKPQWESHGKKPL